MPVGWPRRSPPGEFRMNFPPSVRGALKMLKPCTEPEAEAITVVVENRSVAAQADETVAGGLLRVFGTDYRTHTIGDEARPPYCLMGVCFECLAEVDGIPNRQA